PIERLRNEKLRIAELVEPANVDFLPASDVEGRSRKLAGIAPETGRRQIAMQLLTERSRGNLIERATVVHAVRSHGGEEPRQRIDQILQSRAVRRLGSVVRPRGTEWKR